MVIISNLHYAHTPLHQHEPLHLHANNLQTKFALYTYFIVSKCIRHNKLHVVTLNSKPNDHYLSQISHHWKIWRKPQTIIFSK